MQPQCTITSRLYPVYIHVPEHPPIAVVTSINSLWSNVRVEMCLTYYFCDLFYLCVYLMAFLGAMPALLLIFGIELPLFR